MSNQFGQGFSFQGLKQLFLRNKFKTAIIFLVMMGAVTAFTFLSPSMYQSQAKLYVRLGRENVTLDPTATFAQNPVVVVPHSRETEMTSVLEILRSQELLSRVVDRIGADLILGKSEADLKGVLQETAKVTRLAQENTVPSLAPRRSEAHEKALRSLSKNLKTEVVKTSNIVVITFEGKTPELAQVVVGLLVRYYLEQHAQAHRTAGAQQFLQEQTKHLYSRLTDAEQRLQDEKEKTGIYAPTQQQQLLVERINRLESDLLQASKELVTVEAQILLLTKRVKELPATQMATRTSGISNQATSGMKEQYYSLRLRELELVARYPPHHPAVKGIREQVAAAAALLKKEPKQEEQLTVSPNRLREAAQLALLSHRPRAEALKASIQALQRLLKLERQALASLSANQLLIAKLERDVELQTAQYRKYVDNLEQARIDQAMEAKRISNINIVQPATYQRQSVRPRKKLNLALGFLFALFGSLSLVWLVDNRPATVSTND